MEYDLVLLLVGLAFLGVALLPRLLRGRALGLPPLYVAVGLLAALVPGALPAVDVHRHGVLVERLTELGVIMALTGTGLKIGRPVGLRKWAATWRLLALTMPLSILIGALLAWHWLGFAPAAALLLAAALAPTDPVLAGDVQAAPPRGKDGAREAVEAPEATEAEADGDGGTDVDRGGDGPDDRDVRFALTSEAGLNDGLAFPFVHAALMLAAAGSVSGSLALEWTLGPLLYKCGAGLLAGWLVGRAFAWLAFRAAGRLRLARAAEGFVAIAMTLLAYSIGELVQGYGFLAVFVAAVTLRAQERHHGYHGVLHDFSDQAERLLLALLLLLFGGALAAGALIGLDWRGVAFAAVFLLLVRPLAGLLGTLGLDLAPRAALAVSFLGIRGIGSLYYLAYGLNHGGFDEEGRLWAVVSAVVLLSIVLHGVTAKPVMRWVERGGARGRPRSRRRRALPASPPAPPPP